jgi:hypothetical protein
MRLVPLFFLLFAARSNSWAATINFNELGTSTPIDVNGVHLQGVLFNFIPGLASYNQMVGTAGNAVLSIDPVLSGSTSGTLTMTFDQPTTLLQFDVLLQSLDGIDSSSGGPNGGPAYTVLLSNGLSFNGATAPQLIGGYTEGEFLYTGAPVTSASISFFNGIDADGMSVGAFGIDNLTFGAPEPASLFGLGGGLIALGLLKRRQLAATGNKN